MPLYLLYALGVAMLPIGAVAIAKGYGSKNKGAIAPDGSLMVTVHPGGYISPEPNALALLAIAAGAYYAAKQLKVI